MQYVIVVKLKYLVPLCSLKIRPIFKTIKTLSHNLGIMHASIKISKAPRMNIYKEYASAKTRNLYSKQKNSLHRTLNEGILFFMPNS